jgi:DNA-binding transcriptional MerR regulator
MLSIGEIARITGVSRRMLRHWEETGLIIPASIDEDTGYRRYSPAQVGRIRAISALRSVDFALAEIAHLLDHSQLTEQRLVGLLRAREQELETQVDEASARLTEVRKRLDAIRRGHDTIMSTIELGALPTIRLSSIQATVSDESEIGEAISDLLPRLRQALEDRGRTDSDVVLTYDGTADGNSIIVTAGSPVTEPPIEASGLAPIEVSGSHRGVTVRFDVPPSDVGDAWISLDTSLEEYDLETTGVYRQILTPRGGVILQAPVKERSATTC